MDRTKLVEGLGSASATNGFIAPCRAAAMVTQASQFQLAPRMLIWGWGSVQYVKFGS